MGLWYVAEVMELEEIGSWAIAILDVIHQARAFLLWLEACFKSRHSFIMW